MDRNQKNRRSRRVRKKPEQERNPRRRRSMLVLAVAAGLVTIALAVTVPLLIIRHERGIRAYSGAPTDDHEQLNFDVATLGEYTDEGSDLHPDGTYSRHIVIEKNVDLWLWRDRERPKFPLRNRIGEKFPDFRAYKTREPDGKSAYIAEKCVFECGGKSHTAALIRRSGWDYLIDFSTDAKQGDPYADAIDNVLDGIFFL